MDCSSSDGEVAVLPQMTVPHQEHYFTRVDASSQELERERSAMANLRQDLSFMEHTKRVSLILQSPVFCDELETLIQDQLKKGNNPTNLIALQQISDFMTTTSAPAMLPATPQHGMAALNMSLGMVTPVNDLRGSECIAYERGEKLLRCKLAAFYRLSDLFGWSQLIYNHLTVRLPSEPEHFLIVPFGLLYSEVTASSLVKVNLQGEVMDKGSTNLGVNQAGFTLHSAIYAARPDVKCIVHIHTPAGAAVSAMKRGLLPISPEALALGKVAYHDYQGILVNEEDIQKSLGPESRVLILRNRGLVSVGETVEEAFHYIQNLVTACEIQVRTLANMGGPDNLVMLDPDKYKARLPLSETRADAAQPKWKLGEQQFEALMRMLDNLGYRTGYPYHCPELRQRAKKSSDAELPPIPARLSSVEDFRLSLQTPPKQGSQKPPARPSRSSLGWGDGLSSAGPGSPGGGSAQVWTSIKRGHVKPLLRSLSTGVCVPSCIINCLWSKDDSFRQPGVANQFVPLNTNPKDVQDMRNKIRKQNLQDIKTAGPQSLVLSGAVIERTLIQREIVWEDAPLSDCTDYIEGLDLSEQSSSPAKPTKKGELVTASKAIIEKEYQPGLIISKAGPNPFNKLTDEELEDYCKEVQRKQKETKESQQEENQSDESSITTSQ